MLNGPLTSDPHRSGLLRWIEEFAPQGVFTTDADLVVRTWNRWLVTSTGHDAESMIGRRLFEAFPEMVARGFEPYYRAVLGGEIQVLAHGFHRYVIPLKEPRGREVRQSARIVPLVAEGQIVGTITVIEDVLERVASERELRSRIEASEQARALAEEALRVRDEFLTTLSHEIRTPLNAVLGWTRILIAKGVQDASMLQRALEIIDRNAMAQVRLIDDLLDTARIMSGKLRLEPRVVDLRRVALSALDVVSPTALAKGVELKMQLGEAPVHMLGDPDRLQQIIWNLLANAVKFTPAGGAITIELLTGPDWLSLTVTDTGEGIPEAFLPQLFQRFRQADPSASRRHGGLGIGLSLVRQLVELHGGRIEARSKEGEGSTFTVTFPSRSGVVEAAMASDNHTDTLQGVRVLVTDLDPDNRDLLALILSGHGAEVTAVPELADAGRLLAGLPRMQWPQAIVAAIPPDGTADQPFLHDSTGAGAEGDAIPIVAVLAQDHPDDRRRARASGFAAYVTKPLSPEALVQTVRSVVGMLREPESG